MCDKLFRIFWGKGVSATKGGGYGTGEDSLNWIEFFNGIDEGTSA